MNEVVMDSTKRRDNIGNSNTSEIKKKLLVRLNIFTGEVKDKKVICNDLHIRYDLSLDKRGRHR